MRNYHYLCGIATSCVAMLSACNSHIYVPNTVNEPLLKEKHEFKGSISPSNLQAAFAITDNIAIMANGQYVSGLRPNLDDEDGDELFIDDNTRGGVIEGAVGFFKPLDLKKRMVFDVYGGYGNGSFKTLADGYESDPDRNRDNYLLRTHFHKYFIQPGIGLSHPVIEAAFTSRFSLIKFYNTYAAAKAFGNDIDRRVNYLSIGSKNRFLYEPAFTFRAGYKYVKFQMQLIFSMLIDDNTYGAYDYSDYFEPVGFEMGISVNIANWYDDFRKKRR